MKSYKIIILQGNEYSALVIGTSCESPIRFMENISEDLCKSEIKGNILIDMLMHSGNTDERFLRAYFDGKKFDDSTFQFTKVDRNNDTRRMTANYLKEYPDVVEFSILNKFQKRLLLKGCGI